LPVDNPQQGRRLYEGYRLSARLKAAPMAATPIIATRWTRRLQRRSKMLDVRACLMRYFARCVRAAVRLRYRRQQEQQRA
jgi:hypothetical protein